MLHQLGATGAIGKGRDGVAESGISKVKLPAHAFDSLPPFLIRASKMKLPTLLSLAAYAYAQAGQVALPGDTLQGYPVISNLDLNDVPPNTISRYWISPASASGGMPYLLPLFVARGSEESLESGTRLSVSGCKSALLC